MIAYDDFRDIIEAHELKTELSDVPSSVEMLLKAYGLSGRRYYDLQDNWNDSPQGLNYFHGRTIRGVRFDHRFWQCCRGDNFPFDDMCRCVDEELAAGRMVIISLEVRPGDWRMYVIYLKKGDEYVAFGKQRGRTVSYISNVKERVRAMKGTDILVHRVIHKPTGGKYLFPREEE